MKEFSMAIIRADFFISTSSRSNAGTLERRRYRANKKALSSLNKSILNSRFYRDMVIYILEQLTNKARFGKNPVDFAAINCNSPTIFQDVNLLVNDFISGWSINYSKKTIDAFENIRNTVRSVNPSWTKSLKLGGKRRRRKKTKRRHKKKGKKRKTRRKRKR